MSKRPPPKPDMNTCLKEYNQTNSLAHIVDGEYIKEWLVLGPFFPDDLETDFLADVGGEESLQPQEGDTVAIVDGRTLTWRRYKSKANMIYLFDAVEDYGNAIAYAFCLLQSDITGEAEIAFGNNGGCVVWINGEEAHNSSGDSSFNFVRQLFFAPLKAGANRCLVRVSQFDRPWSFTARVLPGDGSVISGVITDEAGQPIPNAVVRLEENDAEIIQTTTDASGKYSLAISPVRGPYNLSATRIISTREVSITGELSVGEEGAWRLGLRLHEGERQTLNLTLKEAVSIEGTLLMLDDVTPHAAVPVQAIRNGKVIAGTLSDENGKYKFVNLKPGPYQVRCQTLDGYVYYGSSGETIGKILTVEPGKKLKDIDFRFASFKKGAWKNYDTLDGLAYNVVNDIYRDPDGIMWFATCGGGVSRYDGKEFFNLTTNDGLADNWVFAIDCFVPRNDPDGVMWFATWGGGVSRYDGKKFINFTTKDGLAHNRVMAIHCDTDGIIWFATWGGGVSRYNGKKFINFTTKDGLAHNNVNDIYRGPDGMMWFATRGGGVSRYDGKEFLTLTTKDGLADDNVWDICGGPEGIIWFATEGGVSRYDGKEFLTLTTKDGLANNFVRTIYRDPDGVMWFGTENGGVSRYDGKSFVNFSVKDGLANNIVNAIHRDADGTLWFGTGHTNSYRRGGISRYDEKEFLNFTIKDGLANNTVLAIHSAPDGTMWFGTDGGVSLYDGNKFLNFTRSLATSATDGLPHNRVNVIYRDPDGIMWFGTGIYNMGGVSRYDGKKFLTFTTKDGLGYNCVNAIHRAPDGVMWFGTGIYDMGGVSRYDGKKFLTFTTKNGLANNTVTAIHHDNDGVMWFGTKGGGISRYHGKKFDKPLTTENGLAHNAVNAIYRDPNGVMWLGTNGGISVYDGKQFLNFTTKDGLAHNAVLDIYRAPDGVMWLGTDSGGVSGYDGIAWTSLDTQDGLAGNTVTSIHQDAEGFLWFGTEAGITRYRRGTNPSRVYIVSVTTDKTRTDLDDIQEITTGTRATIEYNAIDFKTMPEKRQYRFRIVSKNRDIIEGNDIDSDWHKPTTSTSFDYTFEKMGAYTFEVQAIDRDLNYSKPASVTFKVVQPPHIEELQQTREELESAYRDLKARNAELQEAREVAESAREAAEFANRAKSIFLANMSHEIRTPLNAILGYAQILQRKSDLPSDVRNTVSTIEGSGEHLLALINDILDLSKIEVGRMELQTTDFDLTALINSLSVMFQLRCEQKQLGWRVEWRKEGEWVSEWEKEPTHSLTHLLTHPSSRILVHGDEVKLRQVLSNLLSNAVKFTESGGVVLRISASSDTQYATRNTHHASGFTFEVIDTGIGIPPKDHALIFEPFQQGEAGETKGGTGLGLTIAQKQIQLMGGQLAFESPLLNPPQFEGEVEGGVGTRFFFTLPFEPAKRAISKPEAKVSQKVAHLAKGYQVIALVADDIQENREVLAQILSDIGVEVIAAEDGLQALEMVRLHRPDIAFLDIRMPKMDGAEVARKILSELGRDALKMVAVSASALVHEQERYFEIGFDAFIAKPFLTEQIYGCLASLLHIEYEYADIDSKDATPVELPELKLPEDILRRLKSAAEFYSTTELKSCLNEVARLSEAGRRLAEHLRQYLQNYDMEAIINVLSKL